MQTGNMAMAYILVAFTLLLITDTSSATTVSPKNSTSTASSTPSKGFTRKCEFILPDMQTRDSLSEALQAGSKLVRFRIKFKGYPDDILSLKGGDIFRPALWLRSTNREGESLLMLNDNFEILSLSLLGIGVTNMEVELEERPYGCMNDLTTDERVNTTRELLLYDFKIPGPREKTGSLSQNDRICNMRILSSNDLAKFMYYCCHLDSNGQEECEYIERSVWINVLLVCIIIIKVLVVLYSPSFIPETFYRKKFTAAGYIHKLQGKRKMIKIVKTMKPGTYICRNPSVRLENLEGLDYLNKSLTDMNNDQIYSFGLDRIHLSAASRKLLPENYVPVSVIKLIYDNVFLCKMKRIPVFKQCCDMGICGVFKIAKHVTWFKCLKIFAKLVLVLLLAVPWIIRLIIYFTYERLTMEERKIAANKLKIDMDFNGSFTLYLTPLHGLFIAVYIIVAIDSFAYGLLGRAIKYRFKFILRKCLRDMRERSRLDRYGWAIGLCLLPFRRFGLVGFILAPLYWVIVIPCILPFLAFYTFPTINLSIRLIINIFLLMFPNCKNGRFYKFIENISTMNDINELRDKTDGPFQSDENVSKRNICISITIIIMCLTCFWSLNVLFMECLSFFVEVGVYTLMGIIVNAGATLQYITLLFLIWMYANSSFGGVHKMYLDYHKIIRDLLLKRKHEEMKAVAIEDECSQENTVFRVHSTHHHTDNMSSKTETEAKDSQIKSECQKIEEQFKGTAPDFEIKVKDGLIMWDTKGLLVFLNSVDQPFTPAKFFFETINMNYCGCPGKVWHNTLNAFQSFMKIMVFLLFVVIVVLAFGNQFSTTNQMLATLAGGFVPFVFRNFFMKGSECFTVDTESVQFVAEFDKAIAEYKQKWPVSDIIPAENWRTSGTYTDEQNVQEVHTNHQDIKESTSDDSTTTVDLIIDVKRYDKLFRLQEIDNCKINVGSVSML